MSINFLKYLSISISAALLSVSAYATPENEPVSAPSAPVSIGNSYVQVGAFSVPSNATRMLDRLSNLGYTGVSIPGRVGGKSVQIIRIPNLQYADAYSICQTLKVNNIKCFTGGSGIGSAAPIPNYETVRPSISETMRPGISETITPAISETIGPGVGGTTIRRPAISETI